MDILLSSDFSSYTDMNMMFDHHRNITYRQRIAKDERRFKLADENGDGKMNREEFADFLHPG